MSAGKHTPGPWTYSRWDELGRSSFYVAQQDGAPFTSGYSDVTHLISETVDGERTSVQEANARLIAAAPDLLQALDDLLRDAKDPMDKATTEYFRKQASAAIAKATGTAE